MSGKKSGGRPASYDHAQVRTALEMWCSQFGRVPTQQDRVSGDDIHAILMARFGVSDTIRPESLQKVVDDLFEEFVARQRSEDRAALPQRQKTCITGLAEALEIALVDAFRAEYEFLAKSQFETIRRSDAEKDSLKQKLDEARREIEDLSDEVARLRTEVEAARAEGAAALAEAAALRLENAKLMGRLEIFEMYQAKLGN